MTMLKSFAFHSWKYGWIACLSPAQLIPPQCPPSARAFYTISDYGPKKGSKSAPLQERSMVDYFHLSVKGGDGGDGCTSFCRSQHSRHIFADGGNGGRGGDVELICSLKFWDFSHLQHHFNAKKGGKGSSKRRIGSRGLDKIVQVPVGTVIHLVSGSIPSLETSSDVATDHVEENHEDLCESGKQSFVFKRSNMASIQDTRKESAIISAESCREEHLLNPHPEINAILPSVSASATDLNDMTKYYEVEIENGVDSSDDEKTESDDFQFDEVEVSEREARKIKQFAVAELIKPGESLVVACGGEGGRGNAAMARGRGNQKTLPIKEHEPGHPGTQAYLILELKTIADVGFVGAPNAGKSTLLAAMSRAKPRIGHYAFTTLRPNLGKLEYEDYFSITVADIPGLIKGAHENRGLGHAFLRHIERTKALAYVVDLGAECKIPPWDQLEDLKFELEKYKSGLSNRPSLVIATKMDEEGADERFRELTIRLPCTSIFNVCAVLDEGIHELRLGIRELIENLPRGG